MIKRRFFSLFLAMLLFASLAPPVRAAEPFTIDARAALLVDAGTGETLYEQNAHERNYPASITKVMTALITLENCGITIPASPSPPSLSGKSSSET